MKTDINYIRVLPRDLFNEAKLLKCLGLLILKIEDNDTPLFSRLQYHHTEHFIIGLMDEGSLTCTNLTIWVKGKMSLFKTTYNSKENYPLFLQSEDFQDIRVFDEAGNWDQEFIDFCKA